MRSIVVGWLVVSLVAAGTGCESPTPFGGSPPPHDPAPPPPLPESTPDFVSASEGPCLPEPPPVRQDRGRAAGRICSPDGFCWDHPLPQGSRLDAVYAFEREVWAIAPPERWYPDALLPPSWGSEKPRAFRFDGRTWTAVYPPFTPMHVTAPGVLWGQAGGASVDGDNSSFVGEWDGASLSTRSFPGLGPLEISGTGPDDLWVIGSTPNNWRYVVRWDGTGAHPAHGPPVPFWSLSAHGPRNAWVVAFNYGSTLLVRYDGEGWQAMDPGFSALSVRTAGDADTWAFGVEEAAHFDGRGWTRWATGLSRVEGKLTERHAWWSGPEGVWVVGTEGGIARFDGARFVLEAAPTRAALHGIAGTAPDDVWAVGEAGTILHRDASGWALVAGGAEDGTLRDLWGTGDEDVWAVGARVLHRDAEGWRAVAIPPVPLAGVSGTGPRDVWAVGPAGTALHSDGTCFRPMAIPTAVDGTPIDLTAVWAAAPDDVWAVGRALVPDRSSPGERVLFPNGLVLHWDGTGFRRVAQMPWQEFTAVQGFGPGDGWIGGSWALRIQGGTVAPADGLLSGEAMALAPDGRVAFYRADRVTRWDGREASWAAIPGGVLWDDRTGHLGGIGRATTGQGGNWIASGGWGSDLAFDDGSSFRVVRTPGTQRIRAVWVSPRGTVWAAGDGGAILRRSVTSTVPGSAVGSR